MKVYLEIAISLCKMYFFCTSLHSTTVLIKYFQHSEGHPTHTWRKYKLNLNYISLCIVNIIIPLVLSHIALQLLEYAPRTVS